MDLQVVIDQVVAFVTDFGLRIIGAIALLVLGRLAAGLARHTVRKALERANVSAILRPFVAGLAYYLVLAVIVIGVLALLGVQTASLVAVLGAAGLAVGLALQGTLSNFAAGVMLLVFRPFKPGDFVEVADTSGSVDQVGMFSTVLKTPDNVLVVVPNSSVWGGTIRNYHGFETRRIDLVVGIAYEDDIGTALETLHKVLAADERILPEPAPVVAVNELGASSVDFVVRPWCKTADYWAVRWDLTRRIKEELEGAGCSIPYQQHDVHLVQPAESA